MRFLVEGQPVGVETLSGMIERAKNRARRPDDLDLACPDSQADLVWRTGGHSCLAGNQAHSGHIGRVAELVEVFTQLK